MHWIGVGFLLALGVWLFAVALRWTQRHPSTVANMALLAVTIAYLALVGLGFAYSFWVGLPLMLIGGRALRVMTNEPVKTAAP